MWKEIITEILLLWNNKSSLGLYILKNLGFQDSPFFLLSFLVHFKIKIIILYNIINKYQVLLNPVKLMELLQSVFLFIFFKFN